MIKDEHKVRTVERKIYFYKVVCESNGDEYSIGNLFDEFIKVLDGNYENLEDRNLVTPYYEKYHFLDVKQHEYDDAVYMGKFYSLRSTDFPYLFNMKSGNRTEISSNDQDTLMEQTHFSYFAKEDLIVSEYNYYGARIERLSEYLTDVMGAIFPSMNFQISIKPIIIPEYYAQIIKCTSICKLQFKVANPGLKILAEEGIIGFADVLYDNINQDSSFCIDVEFSGGGRGKNLPTKETATFLRKIVSAIRKGNKYDLEKRDNEEPAFRKAKLKAYNPSESKLVPYDLLDEKLVHTCSVEKLSSKSKYVDSGRMFSEILKAYREKKDDALRYIGGSM